MYANIFLIFFQRHKRYCEGFFQKQSFADVNQNRFLKNFANFTSKHLFIIKRLFNNKKLKNDKLCQKETSTRFSSKICKIYRTSPMAASAP